MIACRLGSRDFWRSRCSFSVSCFRSPWRSCLGVSFQARQDAVQTTYRSRAKAVSLRSASLRSSGYSLLDEGAMANTTLVPVVAANLAQVGSARQRIHHGRSLSRLDSRGLVHGMLAALGVPGVIFDGTGVLLCNRRVAEPHTGHGARKLSQATHVGIIRNNRSRGEAGGIDASGSKTG